MLVGVWMGWGGMQRSVGSGSVNVIIKRVCDTFDQDDYQVQILPENNDHIW